MLRKEPKQFSIFSAALYSRIPESHLLKRIEERVDFSFINELMKDRYCANFGRPAKEPELMMRLLFLKHLHQLSDVQVIEQASLNMAWMWFLGLNLEDELPHPSLLAKFRTQRLAEYDLDDIITEIVRQCVEKGIIQGDGISIDATHVEANTIKKIPERIMKQLAKRIFSALKEDLEKVPEEIDTNIPDYKQIEDPVLAKATMKQYLLKVMQQAETFAKEHTKSAITEAQEVLADECFIIQKGIRSLVDKDARVGRKSKEDRFYGYKVEYTMLADERIITAVVVQSGEKMDGNFFDDLLKRTIDAGIQPSKIYGDKAYFRPDILATIKEKEAEPIIPVSASTYRINEELFSYNKDSDQWFCRMGNYSVRTQHCSKIRDGKPFEYLRYTFDREQCKSCPIRQECVGGSKKYRILDVGLNTADLWEISQKQKNPAFKEEYKKRASIEWKNAELKRFHGLARAKGYGLKSVTIQAKLTVLAANLKRIAAMKGAKAPQHFARFVINLFLFPDRSFLAAKTA